MRNTTFFILTDTGVCWRLDCETYKMYELFKREVIIALNRMFRAVKSLWNHPACTLALVRRNIERVRAIRIFLLRTLRKVLDVYFYFFFFRYFSTPEIRYAYTATRTYTPDNTCASNSSSRIGHRSSEGYHLSHFLCDVFFILSCVLRFETFV